VRSPSKVPPTLQVPNVKVLQFDLSLPQPELNAYAAHAFADFGQVDVLVNNAGYGYMGTIEETEDALVKKQFDINVLGILRTIRAVLPVLREAKSGTVMNLSSVGGLHGYPSNGVYCATKFAIEGITEALAAEIAPFGMRAVIVEPGYFRTSFLTGVSGSDGGDNIARRSRRTTGSSPETRSRVSRGCGSTWLARGCLREKRGCCVCHWGLTRVAK